MKKIIAAWEVQTGIANPGGSHEGLELRCMTEDYKVYAWRRWWEYYEKGDPGYEPQFPFSVKVQGMRWEEMTYEYKKLTGIPA